jgi:hypothetical protein
MADHTFYSAPARQNPVGFGHVNNRQQGRTAHSTADRIDSSLFRPGETLLRQGVAYQLRHHPLAGTSY